MRKNYTQTGTAGADNRIYIDGDWYSRGLPPNVCIAKSVYIDTSYGFAGFYSTQPDALVIEEASGCYDRSSLIVAEAGKIKVGKFTILNGTTLVCKNSISIGSHCMLAWGSVLTDSWIDTGAFSLEQRRALLRQASADPARRFPFFGEAAPIVLEDNCWVGFDSVILPGVRLGRGCVVGCKTVVDVHVPPYAVVSGSPARIVRYLLPTDTPEASAWAMQHCLKQTRPFVL